MNPGNSRTFTFIAAWAAFAILSLWVNDPAAFCQRAGNPLYGTTPGAIPLVNVGGGPMDAQFFALDFAQKILAQQNKNTSQQERERQRALVDLGSLSALDLAASPKAIYEFNQASNLLRGARSEEAIVHLQKAIAAYPKFVSAHNYSAWPISTPTTRQKRKPSSRPPRISMKSFPARF